MWRLCVLLSVLVAVSPLAAHAQAPANGTAAPGMLVEGSRDVVIGGVPAARQGDQATDAHPLVDGSPNVFIDGRPAAMVGGRTLCGGLVVTGASSVFINGKPVARVGDMTSGCLQK